MIKPTLFVLAAGMGSRYGGLKQLDEIGPSGETIMDYSVYDAIRAGFGKIVFVIRDTFAEDFKTKILSKFEHKIPCEICYQAIDKIPQGYKIHPERQKPWGTNHAVLMGKEYINEPFAVINSDDFYGKESFQILADYLKDAENTKNKYCMVAYYINNTLSESGTVNRGVCQQDENGYLTTITERTRIEDKAGQIVYPDENGQDVALAPQTPVSMNMWGFTPDYFEHSEELFHQFLQKHSEELKSEYYIPTAVNTLINKGIVTCQVLNTPSTWFGVTYAEDKPQVVMKINELIRKGVYPAKLF